MFLFDEDDRLRELPFLIVALMIHGGLLSNGLPWGRGAARGPAAADAIAVDFVADLPEPPAPAPPKATPAPAPVPPAPAADAIPKARPGRSGSALRRRPARRARAARRAAKRPIAARPARPARTRLDALREDARRARALEARRARAAAAAARAERREALAREAALEAAERRERALEAQRAARAFAAQREAERVARVREAARRRSEEKARVQRDRIEVSRQLAAIKDPDEALVDAPNDPAPAAEDPDTLAGSGGSGGASLPAAGAGAPDDDPLYDVQREGYDPAAAGGGQGRGGISWSVEGPIGNRRIVRKVLPESPAWLSERGLELAVQIRFQIQPDGRVKPGALIRRTSGFPEVDRRALEALRGWKFETTPARAAGPEAWGSVTFRFLMS